MVLDLFGVGASWQSDERVQRVVQLFRVAHVRPSFVTNFGNGLGVESANFSHYRFRQNAAHLDGAGAALLERSIIEIGVRIGVQNFVRELRGHGRIDGEAGDAAIGDVTNHELEPFEIESFRENVLHHFADQWVLGNGDVAFREVFLASERFWKNRGQQVISAHALDGRRNFLAIAKTKQG